MIHLDVPRVNLKLTYRASPNWCLLRGNAAAK